MLRAGRPVSPLLPMIAAGLVLVVLRPDRDDGAVVLVLLAVFVPWQAWVIVRAVHVLRVGGYVAGRRFEARDRYSLSSEYHDAESASLAARRRRRRKAR